MQKLIAKNLYRRSLISYLLWPFSQIYGGLLKLRRKFYSKHKTYRAPCQIISVGNIVSGGSGKTPTSIWLAQKIAKKGKQVAVSHRGYKGEFEKTEKLISTCDKVLDCAAKAGDEAFLLANKLPGIPVVVGRNRTAAIKLLLENYPDLDCIILDDSFQHLAVAHDLDFLVFNSIGNIGNGFVLPAGILREFLSTAKLADYFVINGEKEIAALNNFSVPQLQAKYKVERITDTEGKTVNISYIKNKKIALLSAIGLPASFEQTVEKAGLEFSYHLSLPDHFNYANNLTVFTGKIKDFDYILTTEKDYAKLQFIQHDLPLLVVETKFDIKGEVVL
ncbi:MAG: tetraacyldisaccharide 4'-kinase [Candidatus Cloacimonadota bacterium]|nr:tetraacyldisaccharide 4'-kinase [Candidatus Cloacimonadota bacterium]